jgi:hypothetical protein
MCQSEDFCLGSYKNFYDHFISANYNDQKSEFLLLNAGLSLVKQYGVFLIPTFMLSGI